MVLLAMIPARVLNSAKATEDLILSEFDNWVTKTKDDDQSGFAEQVLLFEQRAQIQKLRNEDIDTFLA